MLDLAPPRGQNSRDCVCITYHCNSSNKNATRHLLVEWMNEYVMLFITSWMWRVKDWFESEPITHSQDWAPGSSAHRPIGKASRDGLAANHITYIAPVHGGFSYTMHPHSPQPIQILRSSEAPIRSHFLHSKGLRVLGQKMKRLLKTLLHITGFLPRPLTTPVLAFSWLLYCIRQLGFVCWFWFS